MQSLEARSLVPSRHRSSDGVVSAFAKSRAAILLAALFYGYAIYFADVHYLNPVWDYFGFSFREPTWLEALLIVTLISVGAAFLPSTLTRPSSIIVLLLFIVVYVPTMVITLCLDTDRVASYGLSLAFLGIGFAGVCLGARSKMKAWRGGAEAKVPGNAFALCILALWIVTCLVLVATYSSIMSFAIMSDEELYDQRAAGASTSLLMGYVQTYFSNVFSPTLIAYGLLKSRWTLVGIGAVGCVIMFMISAQRTIILLPLAMFAVHFAMKHASDTFRSSSFVIAFIAANVILCSAFYEDNIVVSLVTALLVFRTLALPGLTFSQYHDLFGNDGYTWWSHIKGLSLLIPTPPSYAADAAWPNLGYVVGDRFYGHVEHNVNANLFSGDGVAAAGAFGVAVIAFVFALWLAWLDRTSRGWNRAFAILVTVPVALSLTNGHFFTTLLSFGGLFWMLTFYVYKPGRYMNSGR